MKATHRYTTGERIAMISVQMTVTVDLIAFTILEHTELGGRMSALSAKEVESSLRAFLRSDGDIHYMYRLHEKYHSNEIRNARRVALRLFPSFSNQL